MQDATLAKTCQALLAATSLPQAAATLVDAVRALANPDRVLVLIKDAKTDTLSPAGAHGYAGDATPPHTTPFSQFVMACRKPLLLHMEQANALWQHRAPDVQSLACVPIAHHHHVMGVLLLESTNAEIRFTEAHQQSIEAVLAPVTLAFQTLMLTRAIRIMEHDMRNALGAANLLLFQVLGSDEGSENLVPSLKDTDSAELATLGTLAGTIKDPAERDNYIAHLQQLTTNRTQANELLGGVRTAVNRALAITANFEEQDDTSGSRFNQKAMKSRLRSTR